MAKIEKSYLFVKSFIDELGDPKDWDHFGRVNDLGLPVGSCVCGHQIRYEFFIENKKTHQTKTVGSECINHFKEYNPELFEKLSVSYEKWTAKRKEDAKKAKEALENEKVISLKEKFDSYVKLFNDVEEKYRYANKWLEKMDYYTIQSLKEIPPVYKRPSSYIKFYENKLSKIEKFIQEELPRIDYFDIKHETETSFALSLQGRMTLAEKFEKILKSFKEKGKLWASPDYIKIRIYLKEGFLEIEKVEKYIKESVEKSSLSEEIKNSLLEKLKNFFNEVNSDYFSLTERTFCKIVMKGDNND